MIFSTQGLYMDVYAGTLRTILSELAGESKEESQVVGIRIKTTGSGLVVYSEPILLSITPYVPEPSVEAVSGVIAELTEDNYQLQRPTGEDNPQLFTIGWTATRIFTWKGPELRLLYLLLLNILCRLIRLIIILLLRRHWLLPP